MTRVDPYFPNGAFSPDDPDTDAFVQQWYGKHLRSMDESRLFEMCDPNTVVYRFLCLPTFHAPYMIRIDATPDGVLLTAKKTNGRGGYGPGRVVLNESIELSPSQWQTFENTIHEIGFWRMPTNGGHTGCDGTQCVIEGSNANSYHVVNRWHPDGPFKTLCESFLELCPPTCAEIANAR